MLAPHQSEAVERSLVLLARRGGVLLADEVGLGKSFVAAEVMRRREGVLELITPAALIEQWRATLADFGVHARMLTHDGIVSDAFVARPQRRLVVVDEAHAFRNPRTQRYAALARRCVGARVMLVTATPVCNSISDLEALLRLIARDDLLADISVPSIDVAFERRDAGAIEQIVGALVIRRDRTALPDELQFGTLDRRVIRHPVLDVPMMDDLRFPLVREHALLRRFLLRRLESSEAAFIESLRRQLRFYERALTAIASGRTLPKHEYRRAFAHEEDRNAFQEILFWELFAPSGCTDAAEIREEISRLETLMATARASTCVKRRMLIDAIHDQPMLIFTGSAATAADLRDAIAPHRRCGLVTARERSREGVLRAFRQGALDVVVSTDMAAEGLNLQRAGVVVHYDIPWNPVKLDQRNGRAHRVGQLRPSVRAIYFLPESRETRIAATMARKNRMRRRALQATQCVSECQPTLRPRLTKGAAYVRLHDRLQLAHLGRRHKEGIERMIEEMSGEYLDQRRIDELLALIECEP